MELFQRLSCRNLDKRIGFALILAFCLSILVVYHSRQFYHFRPEHVRSSSRNITQTVQLNDSINLNVRPYVKHRHGNPLYIETGVVLRIPHYRFPSRKKSGLSVNCAVVIHLGQFSGYKEMNQNNALIYKKRKENELQNEMTSCDGLIKKTGYVTDPLTEMERDFPIAYSILVYKDFVQIEMLLRAIYRPQNVYCIHVDRKSNTSLHSNVRRLASCFENVFIAKKSVKVRWGTFSVLEPELICLEELWNKSVTWKYWINLTGQEYPLRTNYELVKILRSMKGASNVGRSRGYTVFSRIQDSGFPPHRLVPVKGAVHVVLSRDFVDYVLHNKTARDLLNWSRDVRNPDEIFFNTLYYNPRLQIPGTFQKWTPGTTSVRNPFIARFKNWYGQWNCHGKQVRGICVFATGDLPLLATREELFANKFHVDFAPEALYCMEELLYNRTLEEYVGILDFNVSYYEAGNSV